MRITKENINQLIEENIINRFKWMEKWDDKKYQISEMKKCQDDIVYFFTNYLWTENKLPGVDKKYEMIPFIPFDFQEDFLRETWESIQDGQKPIEKRKWPTDIFVEKSRQMGVSWMIIWTYLYWYIFYKHDYLIISKDEGEVETCFGRLREMIELLPEWMLPPGLTKKSWTPHHKTLEISRSDGKGSIEGATQSKNAGRGSTKHSVFLDEMAFMPWATEINMSCTSTTPCRIMNSTPYGTTNEYFEMRKIAYKGFIKWFRFHWTEHPLYDATWYENQCSKRTKTSIAQELDIDYEAAVEGKVYDKFAAPTVEFGDFFYKPEFKTYVAIDNSRWGSDPHAIVVIQEYLKNIYIIDGMEINCSVTEIASLLAKAPVQGLILDDAQQLFFERYKNYYSPTFIADPYDTDSAMNDTTIRREYAKYGIHINLPTIQRGLYGNVQEQIRITTTMLPRFKVDRGAKTVISAMQNSTYPTLKPGSTRSSPIITPIHNKWSHTRTAVEYFCLYKYDQEKKIEARTQLRVTGKKEWANPITGEVVYG